MNNRKRGALIGLAVGDALGAAVEFMSPGTFPEVAGYLGGGPHGLSPGQWTDDTQMALDLAESLLKEGGVHPDTLAKRFADSYRWSRGYGPGAARVLKRIRRGAGSSRSGPRSRAPGWPGRTPAAATRRRLRRAGRPGAKGSPRARRRWRCPPATAPAR